MDDSNSQNYVSEKQKAEQTGGKIAETAAIGLGKAYGGRVGEKAIKFALSTKGGQRVVKNAEKKLSMNPATKHWLAINSSRIGDFTQGINSMIGGNTANSNSESGQERDNNVSPDYNNENDKIKDNKIFKKTKNRKNLAIIGCIAGFVSIIIFIVVLITPLIPLGIIEISDSSESGSISSDGGYVSVPNNISYWWPVESDKSVITSPYGQRKDPQDGSIKIHNGIDIAISGGIEPGVIDIIATNSGTVTQVINYCPTTKSIHDGDESDDQCGGRYGNYIMITHDDGKMTVYAHLYSVYVSKDSRVNKGQVIGTMGSSGRSTGTHLHFEVRVNGERQNPENFVSKENRKP